MVSNQELLDILRAMGSKFDSEGDYKVNILFDGSGPFFAQTYASSSVFVCLRAFTMPGDSQRTLLEIAGGGAHSAPADGRLFQHLLTRGLDFDWGAPFARILEDGTVTYGSRLTLPSDILSTANNSFAFVMDMIDVMGKASRTLAQELVPRFGGQSFCGVEKDDIRIVAALASAASLG
jgi:hypothetical protein